MTRAPARSDACILSRHNATVGAGNVLNQSQFVYNQFSQLVTEYQAHEGSVNTSTTAKVQYTYASGAANTIRATGLVYPSGRVLTYSYGSTGSQSDRLSRVASYIDDDGTSHIIDYTFLGAATFVESDRPQPSLKWSIITDQGGADPNTGDIYRGLDRFGRVTDNQWFGYGTGSNVDVDRIRYGYDRAGNRIWRENPVATSFSKEYDEIYSYDALHRLKDMARGRLNTAKTALTSTTFAQCWTLDSTGNWNGFRQDDAGDGTWDLVQARTANDVNEIAGITNSVGASWVQPAYSPAGNMTMMPQPKDPTNGYTATYDAWNRLVKIVDTPTSNTISEYAYDGAKRQIRQKSYDAGTLTETRHLYYTDPASWRSLEERLGTSPDTAAPDRQFVWGSRYIDDLIFRDRAVTSSSSSSPAGTGGNSLGERLFSCCDADFSTTAAITTASTIAFRVVYTSYGEETSTAPNFSEQDISQYAWEYLFQGLATRRSLLTDARNRLCWPQGGSWLTRDQLPEGGRSLYEYLDSAPMSHQDPYGLSVTFPGGGIPLPSQYSIPQTPPISLVDDIFVALRAVPSLFAMIPLWVRLAGTAAILVFIAWLIAQRIASCLGSHNMCLRKAGGTSRLYGLCTYNDRLVCISSCGGLGKAYRFDERANKDCHVRHNQGLCTGLLVRCLLTGAYPPSTPVHCAPVCSGVGCTCC